MHRIDESQEWLLGNSLKEFQAMYQNLSVEPRVFNISLCFIGKDKKVSVPNYWYEGEKEPVVMAYVARGAPLIEKFDVRKPRVRAYKREDGKMDEIKDYERIAHRLKTDFRVLAMLCGHATRNTAISEFLRFKWESTNPAGISTRDKRILKIEDVLRNDFCHGDFNPGTDNAFIFCRESVAEAENAARLNALWMDMIGEFGSGFLYEPPSAYETTLARKVLPKDFFDNPTKEIISRESYQYGTGAHTADSVWFLTKMAERYAGGDRNLPEILFSKEVGEVLDLVELAGERGIDISEVVYRDGEKHSADRCIQIVEEYLLSGDSVRCIIQEPPEEYFDRSTREMLSECYPRFPQRPFYRIYKREIVERMADQGRVVEALGFGVQQLPHYVSIEQPAET